MLQWFLGCRMQYRDNVHSDSSRKHAQFFAAQVDAVGDFHSVMRCDVLAGLETPSLMENVNLLAEI